MSRIFFLIFLIGTGSMLLGQQATPAVAFTLEDRDRIIRTEQKVEALSNSVDARFDASEKSVNERFEFAQKQLDNIFNLMLFLLGGMMGLIGFVIYDRRTLLQPLSR